MKSFVLLILSISYLTFSNTTKANEGIYFSPKINLSYSQISDVNVLGSYQKPFTIYTDQDKDNTDNTTFDIVGGALLSLGYKSKQWRAEISYNYRYRFDLNGNVGEPVPGKYERHDNLPGRFTLNINTQSLRFDYNYYISAWKTENLSPYIGFNIDYLKHDILSKVRYQYNYSEEKVKQYDLSYGVGLGTEIIYSENLTWLLSIHYVDLGSIEVGPQSNNAIVKANRFNAIDILFGFNYFF